MSGIAEIEEVIEEPVPVAAETIKEPVVEVVPEPVQRCLKFILVP